MKKFLFSLVILLSCGAISHAMEQEGEGITQENLEKLLELDDRALLNATEKYGAKAAPLMLRRKQIQSLIDKGYWVIKNKFSKDIYVRIKHNGVLADLKNLQGKPIAKCENDPEERHVLSKEEYVVIDVKKEFPITIRLWKELNKEDVASGRIHTYSELQNGFGYPYGELIDGRDVRNILFAHLSYKDQFQSNDPNRYTIMRSHQTQPTKRDQSTERYTSLN